MPEYLIIIPDMQGLSLLILILLLVVSLYIARSHAHKAILSFSRVIRNSLRLASHSLLQTQRRLNKRNKEVLLSTGASEVERAIEREFHRVDSVVKRDLGGYPALNRSLSDLVTKIDEDYGASTETPPPPPEWTKAVKTVADIPSSGDSMVATVLKAIHKTIIDQDKKVMDEYRKSTKMRHALLKRMMPFWRKLTQTLSRVDKTITGLHERSRDIDKRMTEFEEIRRGTDTAVRTLTSSALTQFFISGFVLSIAIAGAIINFNLIALPMSEMVGGGSYIGPYKTSDIAALVIILVEISMGLFLMESLRITKLFPVIGALDDKMRTRMIYITFSILFILAGVEAALAFMRDIIAADMQALRQSLSATQGTHSGSLIPTIGQMVMGFILPFALTFVAIPMESFVHSARTVLGVVTEGVLRALAFIMRLVGNITMSFSRAGVHIYDLIIFLPLGIESLGRGGKQGI
ncbi:MAG: hypothetical protein KAT46_06910, partial [Deltaproteobacteria bacterium]|nr:hypothetical protein [Deltaproteobacteria bacterium]